MTPTPATRGAAASSASPACSRPRIAGRDKWERIEALGGLVAFRRAYRVAWGARRAGAEGVRFPLGTYLLRVFHDVPCVGFG